MIIPAPILLAARPLPPFAEAGWIYQIKFDGHRLMAGVKDSVVQLVTRNGADATKWFPGIVAGLASLRGGAHVLDGEICVLDEFGRSDFNRLQDRARKRRWYKGADPFVFSAIELLERTGLILLRLPVERQGLLPAPARSQGNYRVYEEAHVRRLAFIRHCRSLDMTRKGCDEYEPAGVCSVRSQRDGRFGADLEGCGYQSSIEGERRPFDVWAAWGIFVG